VFGKWGFGDAIDKWMSTFGPMGGGDMCGGYGTRGRVVFAFFFSHVSVVIQGSLRLNMNHLLFIFVVSCLDLYPPSETRVLLPYGLHSFCVMLLKLGELLLHLSSSLKDCG